jgi:polysaccharide export outer membrane protein
MISFKSFVFVLVLLTVGSFAVLGPLQANADPPAPPTDSSETTAYRIQTDDVLDISLIDEPDLTHQVTVLPDGTISYLYATDITARGLTLAELRQKLVTAFSKQYVHPQITVSVVRHTAPTVSVVGAVKLPGMYPITESMHVLDAIGAAGGLIVTRPEYARVLLLRKGSSTPTAIDLKRIFDATNTADNVAIGPGDLLIIAEKAEAETQIQVIGEVNRQGIYPATGDISLVSALSLAGGLTPNAAPSRAIIRRGQQTIPVNLRAVLKSETEATPKPVSIVNTRAVITPKLQPGDTLFIPTNEVRFAVIGAVNKPGALPYPEEGSIDVLDAIYLAGGQTAAADLKNVILVKPGTSDKMVAESGTRLNLWDDIQKRSKGQQSGSALPKMEPGDILFIPDKGGRQRSSVADFLPIVGALGWILRL